MNGTAASHQLCDQGGHVGVFDRVDDQPLSVEAGLAETAGDGPRILQPRHQDADTFLLEQLRHAQLGHDSAAIDDGHPAADPLDFCQQVRVEEHRHATSAERADDLPHVLPPDGIEGRSGFVEDHKLGLAEQGDPEAEALLHTLRIGFHPVVRPLGQTHEFERFVDLRLPGRARHVSQLAMQREHLVRRHPALVAKEFREIPDSLPRGQIAQRRSQDEPLARRRTRESEQQLDRRRLARPIRPEEAEDFAASDRHRKAGQGDGPSELFAQLSRLDGRGPDLPEVGRRGTRFARYSRARRRHAATRRSARRSWRSPGRHRCTSTPARTCHRSAASRVQES